MPFYADLHIHSKYSRATSRDCDLENLALWGRKKGITVIGTGDFTHPAWIQEIKSKLVPAEPGLFRLKEEIEKDISQNLAPGLRGTTRFMLSVEISTIYKKGDRTRKVHHLIYSPSIEQAEQISKKLASIGNIRSDGRPIIGLDSRHLLEIVLEAGEGCYLVPAHIWTPWFAVLGSKSGFDRIDDCYGDLADHIFAVETGLSSDPEMNRRISQLDRYRLVSNSDAHSPQKLGREATVFASELDYFSMKRALETGTGYAGTVEFFPEEGKYHLDGHRNCGVRFHPEESRRHHGNCPACLKPLTLGVMYRVEELADRRPGDTPAGTGEFESLIPLPEVIGEIHRTGVTSKKVQQDYECVLARLGPELPLLAEIPADEIRKASSPLMAEAITRMREGRVIREAGYDGEYGKIRLFDERELETRVSARVLFDLEKSSEPSGKPAPAAPSTTFFAKEEAATRKARDIPAPLPPLDPDQQNALEILTGPLLIVAGPGSGKTRTLTHRIAQIIRTGRAKPQECLTITFTRRAAREMQERLDKLIADSAGAVPVRTFHGFGFEFIRENRELLGLPRGIRLLDDLEKERLCAGAFGWSTKKTKCALEEASAARRDFRSPAAADGAAALEFLTDLREREGLLDYDDLLILPLGLLEENEGVRELYRRRHPYISIDEYQDIDELQYRLIRRLASEDGNLCAIGDPDQSIYSFRGADVGYFLRFTGDFPGARTIRLTKNYRSGPSILKASSQMISPASLSGNIAVPHETLDAGKIMIHHARTAKAEAEFVVERIEKLLGGISFFSRDSGRAEDEGKNYSFSDFAVLYRTEEQAEILEEAFLRSGIPYQRFSHRAMLEDERTGPILEAMRSADGNGEVLERLLSSCLALKIVKDREEAVKHPFILALSAAALRAGKDLDAFMQEICLGLECDEWDPRAARVSLMTLHAAKGLEFPVVFITGCEDRLLPLSWGPQPNEAEIAEERRLFYVGMTRAREMLFLSHAAKRKCRGKMREQTPSPFLEAIEEELFERHRSERRTTPRDNVQMELL